MLTMFLNTNVDFMGKRRFFFVCSGVLTLIAIVSIIAHGGLRYGIDFAGGRMIEYRMSQSLTTDEVRAAVSRAGFADAEIQPVKGQNQVLIRIPSLEAAEQKGGEATPSARIREALQSERPGLGVELLREESIGAKVGKEIRNQAVLAILISLGLILIYIAFRFEFRFGVGGVVSLAHDVIITMGVLSVLNREFTMPVVAALLTIVGYSINDTIIVYDRVREQLVKLRREPFDRVINLSVNQTLSRTIITSLTVFLTALALLLFGGPVIRDFALTMAVGVFFGTYSSVYVASALVVELREASAAKAAKAATS
jgi:preprotein translocase subunit SecF